MSLRETYDSLVAIGGKIHVEFANGSSCYCVEMDWVSLNRFVSKDRKYTLEYVGNAMSDNNDVYAIFRDKAMHLYAVEVN